MDHSQGPIYAWDGVGTFTYGGHDYLGVAGYVQIEGVSNSGDIQNHDIYVTLNGAGLTQLADIGIRQECVDLGPALATTDLNIRGRAVTLTLVWLAEDGTIVDSQLILKGKGDIVKINGVGDTFAIKARIRPPIAAWDSPPRSYYTPEDQAEKFAGDTGFDFVADLQNATVSGWSNVAEIGGGNIFMYAPGSPYVYYHPIANTLTNVLLGDDAWGIVKCGDAGAWNSNIVGQHAVGDIYEEETTAVRPVGGGSQNANVLCSGSPITLDGSGVARTAGGKRIVGPSQDLSRFIREQGQIASNGTAGSETITCGGSSQPFFRASGGTTTQKEFNLRRVYDNQNGGGVLNRSGACVMTKWNGSAIVNVPYVEDVTGTAVTSNSTGTGNMQVGGSDCHVSTTGVILSPSGRRLVLSGGDPAKDFLRIWV
jgi:hypothetical protein